MPLHKEVPRSDIKTKFMKSSSFRKVFGLFFVVIFTQDRKIIRFHYILLNLTVKTKYTVKALIECHGVLFFNPFPKQRSIRDGVQLESGALICDYLVRSLGR